MLDLLKYLMLLIIAYNSITIVKTLERIEHNQQSIVTDQQDTHLQATQANELVKYWLPPVSQTRMSKQCSRCHR